MVHKDTRVFSGIVLGNDFAVHTSSFVAPQENGPLIAFSVPASAFPLVVSGVNEKQYKISHEGELVVAYLKAYCHVLYSGSDKITKT